MRTFLFWLGLALTPVVIAALMFLGAYLAMRHG